MNEQKLLAWIVNGVCSRSSIIPFHFGERPKAFYAIYTHLNETPPPPSPPALSSRRIRCGTRNAVFANGTRSILYEPGIDTGFMKIMKTG